MSKTSQECYIILWGGVDEFTIIDGDLNDVIEEVKRDRNYNNYGRTGAKIVKATALYEITEGGKETLIDQGRKKIRCCGCANPNCDGWKYDFDLQTP